MNADLAEALEHLHPTRAIVSPGDDFESPHVKARLLLMAHMTRFEVDDYPVADYATDTKSVLVCAGHSSFSAWLNTLTYTDTHTHGR